MGARKPPAPAANQEEDPSIASFPDLQVPTPFEWFPSSNPGSGQPAGAKPSERSFGQTPPEPTMTKTAAVPPSKEDLAQTAPRPAAGTAPDPSGSFRGFGAVDEPPSLYSTPSASVPSFPSMSASSAGMPSPTGEPLPGQFGEVRDLSLVSSSGVNTAPGDQARTAPGFGHVSDLSLISTSTSTETSDAITEARKQALDAGTFDDGDDTEALHRGAPAKPIAPQPIEDADLPTAVPQAELPAAVRGKAAAAKRAPGMGATGGSQMLGKPPPAAAPQPFGKMEKINEPMTTPARTAPMTAKPAPGPVRPAAGAPAAPTTKSPARPPPQQVTTAPMQQRDSTSPLNKSPVPPAPSPFASQAAAPFASHHAAAFASAPPAAFASAPPAAFGPHTGSSAPAAYGQQNPTSPFGSGAMPPAPAPMQMPPPVQTQAGFGSAPPPPIPQAQQAPPPPPIFGQYQSSPPGGGMEAPPPFDPGIPFQQNQVQQIGYAAPVLVDVTPRGLVVETAGGYTDTIIPRNSKIPCERTRRFATGRDMQTMVRVRVAQGEHPHFGQNTYLGEVELSGLRPAHRGDVVVAVTFEVDADGTLRIRARDVATGLEARAVLQLVGVADESSVVMMINRFAQQPVVGGPTQ
jgi:molecular chaperone DnaK